MTWLMLSREIESNWGCLITRYIPCLYALNKIDAITIEELDILDNIPHYVPICADLNWNLDELVDKIWEYLNLVRVYTKPKGEQPGFYKVFNY